MTENMAERWGRFVASELTAHTSRYLQPIAAVDLRAFVRGVVAENPDTAIMLGAAIVEELKRTA